MDKYISAIVEYENARVSIISAKDNIGKAIAIACTDTEIISELESSSCLDRLYSWNKYVKVYHDNDGEIDYGYHVEYMAKPDEKPTLCERCKNLDEKIQYRKLCKKNYGIAKRRISSMAKPLIGKLNEKA